MGLASSLQAMAYLPLGNKVSPSPIVLQVVSHSAETAFRPSILLYEKDCIMAITKEK